MNKEDISRIFVQMSDNHSLDGVITYDQLTKEFAEAGIYVNDDLLNDIFEFATDNEEQTITFKQFTKLMDIVSLEDGENPTKENYEPEFTNSEFPRAIKLGFDEFDRDEDNKINHTDLKDTLVEHSYSGAPITFENASDLSPQELALIVYAIDKNNGDAITKQGLSAACQKKKSVFFQKDEISAD